MTAMVLLSAWMESQVEFWRKTKYEGYDVSNWGRVRSYWIIVANKGWSKGAKGVLGSSPKLLKCATDDSGYLWLHVRQGRNCPKVHRLVADAFLPPRKDAPEINHKTGLKGDNRLGNLERVTHLENIRHAIACGLKDYKRFYGDRHYNSKISDERILEMQALYDQGLRPVELAPLFGITLANTYDLAKGARGRGKTLREKNRCRD